MYILYSRMLLTLALFIDFVCVRASVRTCALMSLSVQVPWHVRGSQRTTMEVSSLLAPCGSGDQT